MPFSKQPSNELLKPSEDMVFGLELRKISSKRHSSSKTAKESSALSQSSRSPKDDADKLKPESSGLKQKTKKDAEGKIKNRESFKKSATQSDELVRHMSNLPGYLLQPDKRDNSKEKAFNVGVLDWSRLEQWKHKNNHMPVLASNFASFNSSGSSSSSRAATKSTTSVCVKEKVDKKKCSASSGIRPSNREWVPESSKRLPFENVKRNESSRSETKSIGDEQRMRGFESIGKTHSDISHEKRLRTESSRRTSQDGNFASSSRHHRVSHVRNEIAKDRDDGARQNKDGLQDYNQSKKERHRKSSSDIGSVRSKNKEVLVSSKSSSSRETRKKVDQLKESDFEIGPKHKHCHSKLSNSALLYPQEIPQTSSSGNFQLSELRTSSDENLSGSSQSSLSYVSLPEEVCTEDVCSEIPHSSALCSAAEFTSSSDTMGHNIGANLDMDCSSVVSETPASASKIPSRHSLGACSGKDVFDTNLRNQCVFSNIKESLDQEAAELTAPRGIYTSHNRRFSFSLSRIGRSFSFKEPPTLPQLNSIYVGAKSGPVTPETSVRWDNQSKDKGNSSRIRSSPLRRLLDPLLRHKASGTHHSSERSHAQKGSMDSVNFTSTSFNESLPAERSKGSSVQGLLQLTMKNGLPLFKFVLNNDGKILAATRRSLTSLEKDDIGCYFTFYLVNEIKKKSGGWMHHGSKGKSCGYAYNCIAQMKFSSSKITEPTNQNAKRQRMVKEYILLGVNISQTEQGQPRLVQSGELAAVIIETPCEDSSNKGMCSDGDFLKKGCLKCLADERCLCSSGENVNSCSTTVILPGGVHGSPNKGEPSPLIYRWKTGGSCDCGGWDIGCKLLVLSNQKQRVNIPRCSVLFDDRFQLFVQEGAEQDKPLFTLSPLKDGFYTVEFSSSITYLQAFFISVAVLSCQKLPSSLEMGNMLEEILKEPSSKNNSRHQGKASIKYTTPIPPLSPVGRV